MKSEFNYWDKEHYVITSITSSEDDCKNKLDKEIKDYPSFLYGTHLAAKTINEDACTIIIKRFKSIDLLEKHVNFPPTYVREGRVL